MQTNKKRVTQEKLSKPLCLPEEWVFFELVRTPFPMQKKKKTPISNAISIMVVYVAVYQNLVLVIASKLISLVPRNIKKGAAAQWPIKTSSLLDNRPP